MSHAHISSFAQTQGIMCWSNPELALQCVKPTDQESPPAAKWPLLTLTATEILGIREQHEFKKSALKDFSRELPPIACLSLTEVPTTG